ncbi:1-phosphofructokinase family hexose kinase [Georgenia halophila]|uniref:1-phosphofructokinase family hexose kinase n=1 Tax=Georgenia halophila TaxID=620889 RepID=A0ABP8L496_9MICO
MILAVTPNPALDLTYTVPALEVGAVHRVQSVAEAPGGKGVNVARVLTQLGETVTCAGFLGGATGRAVADRLDAAGIAQAWIPIDAETRRTVNVVDAAGATLLNEPGPTLDAGAWERLTGRASELLGAGDVLTVSGSLPPGSPDGALPSLVRAAAAREALVVVDTSGPGLLAAAAAGAHVLKPNEDELLRATGADDVLAGAAELIDAGAAAVLVSQGSAGALLVVRGPGGRRACRCRPAEVLQGNPTGAGDAAVAAIARALSGADAGAPLDVVLARSLPDVVALSGAAVLAPTAGAVDLDAYGRMTATVRTEEIRAH